MAPHVRQWPVCRKRCAGLLRAWTGRMGSGDELLSLERTGLWQLASPRETHHLRLVHAWPSSLWMALRFHTECPTGLGAPLELTVWKSGLSDDAWRALRLSVERQIVMRRGAHKEGS